jgi:hypothetical protein
MYIYILLINIYYILISVYTHAATQISCTATNESIFERKVLPRVFQKQNKNSLNQQV